MLFFLFLSHLAFAATCAVSVDVDVIDTMITANAIDQAKLVCVTGKCVCADGIDLTQAVLVTNKDGPALEQNGAKRSTLNARVTKILRLRALEAKIDAQTISLPELVEMLAIKRQVK